MNGYEVKARRHARQIVQDMRWHDMTVPPLYGHMAWEFQELVRSGEYTGWSPATSGPRRSPERCAGGHRRPTTAEPIQGPADDWRPAAGVARVPGKQALLTDSLIRERAGSEG